MLESQRYLDCGEWWDGSEVEISAQPLRSLLKCPPPSAWVLEQLSYIITVGGS